MSAVIMDLSVVGTPPLDDTVEISLTIDNANNKTVEVVLQQYRMEYAVIICSCVIYSLRSACSGTESLMKCVVDGLWKDVHIWATPIIVCIVNAIV